MKIKKVHFEHLKSYNVDIFNNEDLNTETSETYSNDTMIETKIYEEDLHIETFYTQYLPHEQRFVSWCEDECQQFSTNSPCIQVNLYSVSKKEEGL